MSLSMSMSLYDASHPLNRIHCSELSSWLLIYDLIYLGSLNSHLCDTRMQAYVLSHCYHRSKSRLFHTCKIRRIVHIPGLDTR